MRTRVEVTVDVQRTESDVLTVGFVHLCNLRYQGLAIGCLAERRGILWGDTNRTITLLRHRRIVDDQHRILATDKAIALEFVVPTVLAIALGIVLSIGAVYLIDNYLVPIDQAEAYHSVAGSH
jgi:hypothetical protein